MAEQNRRKKLHLLIAPKLAQLSPCFTPDKNSRPAMGRWIFSSLNPSGQTLFIALVRHHMANSYTLECGYSLNGIYPDGPPMYPRDWDHWGISKDPVKNGMFYCRAAYLWQAGDFWWSISPPPDFPDWRNIPNPNGVPRQSFPQSDQAPDGRTDQVLSEILEKTNSHILPFLLTLT
jgi:hypothetical protein